MSKKYIVSDYEPNEAIDELEKEFQLLVKAMGSYKDIFGDSTFIREMKVELTGGLKKARENIRYIAGKRLKEEAELKETPKEAFDKVKK